MNSLLDTACELIPSLIGTQSRYKVSELPTERTLRYYMSMDLMDRPAAKRGTLSIFTYRHLLQVLAVKHLQSQYIPLRRIRTLLRGASNRELENILPGGSTEPARVSRPSRPLTSPESRGGGGRGSGHAGTWSRYEIGDGIELHVRGRTGRNASPELVEACREAVRKVRDGMHAREDDAAGEDRSR